MNIYYEILVMFFARALLLFFKQRSKIFCIWSPVDLYHLNCQYFLIHNETAQSSIYKYLSIKLTTVNCSGVSNYKHSHGILVHFENRCWANSMMELIAVDTVTIQFLSFQELLKHTGKSRESKPVLESPFSISATVADITK